MIRRELKTSPTATSLTSHTGELAVCCSCQPGSVHILASGLLLSKWTLMCCLPMLYSQETFISQVCFYASALTPVTLHSFLSSYAKSPCVHFPPLFSDSFQHSMESPVQLSYPFFFSLCLLKLQIWLSLLPVFLVLPPIRSCECFPSPFPKFPHSPSPRKTPFLLLLTSSFPFQDLSWSLREANSPYSTTLSTQEESY